MTRLTVPDRYSLDDNVQKKIILFATILAAMQ